MSKVIEKIISELPDDDFWQFIKEKTEFLKTDGDPFLLETNIEDLKKVRERIECPHY